MLSLSVFTLIALVLPRSYLLAKEMSCDNTKLVPALWLTISWKYLTVSLVTHWPLGSITGISHHTEGFSANWSRPLHRITPRSSNQGHTLLSELFLGISFPFDSAMYSSGKAANCAWLTISSSASSISSYNSSSPDTFSLGSHIM